MDDNDKHILAALNELKHQFARFEARVESDYKHLKEILADDFTELRNRVNQHGKQIDELTVTVAKNKESQDAAMRTTKMFGAVLVGFLVFIEVAVLAVGLFVKLG